MCSSVSPVGVQPVLLDNVSLEVDDPDDVADEETEPGDANKYHEDGGAVLEGQDDLAE